MKTRGGRTPRPQLAPSGRRLLLPHAKLSPSPLGPARDGSVVGAAAAPGTAADSRSCAPRAPRARVGGRVRRARRRCARVGGAAPPNFSATASAALANARRWSSAAARASFPAAAGQPSSFAESTTTAAARKPPARRVEALAKTRRRAPDRVLERRRPQFLAQRVVLGHRLRRDRPGLLQLRVALVERRRALAARGGSRGRRRWPACAPPTRRPRRRARRRAGASWR